jgi:hypothetical protein
MDLGLSAAVVAVTGSARGAALELAMALVAEGASVAFAAASREDLTVAHGRVEQAGGRCLAYACDLSEPGEATAFLVTVAETFGRIDGLVSFVDAGAAAAPLSHAVEAFEALAATGEARAASALFVTAAGAHWVERAAAGALAEAVRALSAEGQDRPHRLNAVVTGGEEDGARDLMLVLLSPASRLLKGQVLPVRHGHGPRRTGTP